jgi:nitroreductase
VSWKLWILVGFAVVFIVGVGMAARALVMDVAREVRVGDVLKEHDAELRAIPGVTMLGTHSGGGDPAHIVVYVDKVTPEVRAAVPATLDGYRVDVEAELVLPPSPPMLVGVVKNVTPATPEQAAAGIAGVLTIEGDLYKVGYGESKPSPRTMVVLVPSALQIWRPQGEGKEFIGLADVRVGETANVTLTAVPKASARRATAADLEAYGQM